MDNCIFCKIVSGEIGSKKVYEDDTVLAFCDIHPMAPTHILVIPKEHIGSIAEITSENSAVVAHMAEVIAKLAEEHSWKEGFRVVSNVGEHGCQSVHHLHFHVLAGRQMSETLS